MPRTKKQRKTLSDESENKSMSLSVLQVPDEQTSGVVYPPGAKHDFGCEWARALELAAEWIVQAAGSTCVSTGAGASAESGIPTYRDEGGST